MVYEWKVNGIYKTDANVAGKVLEELNNTIGLTNENLVNASRPEDAPLHNEFEWDDTIAAEKYRNVQAGKMINLLAVRIEEQNEFDDREEDQNPHPDVRQSLIGGEELLHHLPKVHKRQRGDDEA
jgi:hypothetical protein